MLSFLLLLSSSFLFLLSVYHCLTKQETTIHVNPSMQGQTAHLQTALVNKSHSCNPNFLVLFFVVLHAGWEHAFLKQTWQAVDSLNTPYDYSSIMHYKLNAFSRSSRRKTIVPRKNVRARPYRKISKIDALQVKRMYNCYGTTFLAFLS